MVGINYKMSFPLILVFVETAALVRDYILMHPDVYHNTSKFIEGSGWDHTSWPVEEWPTAVCFIRVCLKKSMTLLWFVKDALDDDPVIRGRPVVLQSKDGHALWVSKTVLQQSHGSLVEDVEGGVIIRDTHGEPTGSSGPLTVCLILFHICQVYCSTTHNS